MATQSSGFIVYYIETGSSKHLELSDWAKRKYLKESTRLGHFRKQVVEKFNACKKLLLHKH